METYLIRTDKQGSTTLLYLKVLEVLSPPLPRGLGIWVSIYSIVAITLEDDTQHWMV